MKVPAARARDEVGAAVGRPAGQRASTLVVIPALNEEASLPAVVAGLRAAHPNIDVLVVDDGSSDATARVAASAGALVARLPFNLGIGGALRTGFRYAVRHGYRRAIQMDADGQHDARDIVALIDELDRGSDLVIGSRFAGESTYQVGGVRSRAMSVLRLTVGMLAGRRFTDTSSGFRAFSRPMLEFFAASYPLEYLSDTVEALLIACYAGFRVAEVPVSMQQRAAGRASHSVTRSMYQYVRVLVALGSMASLRGRRRGAAA